MSIEEKPCGVFYATMDTMGGLCWFCSVRYNSERHYFLLHVVLIRFHRPVL